MTLPSEFVEMMRTLLGAEAGDFLQAMQKPPVCSVRLNTRKPGASFHDSSPVKWCHTGLYLPQRPVFTLDPLLHAGAYYVQDASSMIYREVTSRIVEILGGGGLPLCVADLCAAPGGKTTAIIDALPDGSKVVANEFMPKRADVLRENLIKWGYPNVSVLNHDTSYFTKTRSLFDIVAVDAPCSGEGMMRKDEDAVTQWSPTLVESCARLQREILANAVAAVKPGGFLIYSTCTFNRTENEENAQYICDELQLNPFGLDFPAEWGIPGGIDTRLPVYRFMPHKTEGEGLFLAVFRKPGEWEPSYIPNVNIRCGNRSVGKEAGKGHPRKKISDKPSHKETKILEAAPEIEEILSVDFDRGRYPEASLSREQALSYLRREAIVLPPDTPKGIVIVAYDNLPLGAVKNIGSRANNLYPKNWRIRMI